MTIGRKTGRLWQLRHTLSILVQRDLRVRYARSWLGYLWTVLDPLLMALIYYVVFVHIFHRGNVGHHPYFLFLIVGLLSWQWFSASITDTSRALIQEAKLLRSTNLPREIWVIRVVIAKTIEYLLSLPVLVAFAAIYLARGETHLNARIVLFPFGVVLEFVFLIGVGLLLAPVNALVTDTQRVVRILLRMGFYATPVIYAVSKVSTDWQKVFWFNPLTGILELLRAGFFDDPTDYGAIGTAVGVTALMLVVGIWTFGRLERAVLKEV